MRELLRAKKSSASKCREIWLLHRDSGTIDEIVELAQTHTSLCARSRATS